jgi:transcriptional regulator with XRE-family HTH domain
MADASPTLRQRELGTRLRQLRNGLGLTVDEVGNKLLCSPTKISRVETGARRPSLRDVRDLCALYGVDEVTSAELMNLAREAREEGWWTHYGDLKLDPYIGLEQEATSITAYSMYYVPALMQTEGYAKAIIKAILRKIDPAVHQERVEARLLRQKVLERSDPPRYRVLLDEAVLHRPVGGPAVMADQLAKVLELEQQAKVAVQVIPFDAGAHAAQDSNFVFFEFDKLSPIVFVEGLIKHQYQERKADIDRYREAVEYLRDAALSPRDSVRRIAQMRKAYAEGVVDSPG